MPTGNAGETSDNREKAAPSSQSKPEKLAQDKLGIDRPGNERSAADKPPVEEAPKPRRSRSRTFTTKGSVGPFPANHAFSEAEFIRVHPAVPPKMDADDYYDDALNRLLMLGAITETPNAVAMETPISAYNSGMGDKPKPNGSAAAQAALDYRRSVNVMREADKRQVEQASNWNNWGTSQTTPATAPANPAAPERKP